MPLFSHQKQELIDAVNEELPRNLVCAGIQIELTNDHGVPVEMVCIDIKPLGKKPEGFSQRERVRRCVAEALLAIGGSDFHGILYEDKQQDDGLIRFVHRAFL